MIHRFYKGDLVTMKWPPQSPDLNPIEPGLLEILWDIMGLLRYRKKK